MNMLKRILYLLLIIGIAFYMMSPLLRGEYNYPLGEYEIYKSFMVNFIDTLKHGELPVWNEYIGGGHPAMYFGHYPITQNTFLYMLFGVKDSTYYFVRFLDLIILLATFVYACKLLKFGYLMSLIGALVYFNGNFISRWLVADTLGNLVLGYPLLVILIVQIIKDRQLKAILIFSLVYIFWLTGGHITYVYAQVFMLSVVYWVSVLMLDAEPLKLSNLKKRLSLYFILFFIPVTVVLYQYYFVYDIIKVSNRLKEGLIASPFEPVVWKQLWRSFQSSSYFLVGLFLTPFFFIRKSAAASKLAPVLLMGLMAYSVAVTTQSASIPDMLSDYAPLFAATDFRLALQIYVVYIILSQLIFKSYSHFIGQVRIGDFVVFIVYLSLLSYFFYLPDSAVGFDYLLYNELSGTGRVIFILCILFSMESYRKNQAVKVMILSLVVLYLMRSHLTIPLMRFSGVVWYPIRDGVILSALFAFLFLFGLKNVSGRLFSDILKINILRNNNTIVVRPVRYAVLLVLLVLLVQDSSAKFYDGQTNKIIFPNRIQLTGTLREFEILKSREEIPLLNSRLLELGKTTEHFYRIFTPEAVFTYLTGSLQGYKIYDAAIYESSISKEYKDFFDYVILRKAPPDNKDLKNVLPHAVFTKHVLSGLNSYVGSPYNDVYLFSPEDAPYLRNQNVEFFWDLMQVKYLVIGSEFSKALEAFSNKGDYKLLGHYPNLDLHIYEITKNKKYGKLGILPLRKDEDFTKVSERINSGDADVLTEVYARVVHLDEDTKDYTLLSSRTGHGKRHYEIEAKKRGMLIEFESWNRHWRLRANGEKGAIYKAFGIFRGIMIEPGKNVIELEYTVPYFKELFWLSIIVLCIYGVLLIKVLHDEGSSVERRDEQN